MELSVHFEMNVWHDQNSKFHISKIKKNIEIDLSQLRIYCINVEIQTQKSTNNVIYFDVIIHIYYLAINS